MPRADLQTVLARLYTDAAFRDAFLQRPEEVAAALDLAERDREALFQVDRDRLRLAARSLVAKRSREAASLVPELERALGERWEAIFRAHAARFRPGGAFPIEADALRLAETLARDRTAEPEVRTAARAAAALLGLRFAREPGWSPGSGALRRRRGGVGLWWADGCLLLAIRWPGRRHARIRRLRLLPRRPAAAADRRSPGSRS